MQEDLQFSEEKENPILILYEEGVLTDTLNIHGTV